MASVGITRTMVKDVIAQRSGEDFDPGNGGIRIREGAVEFLNWLGVVKVKTLVFSGGLRDVVEDVLEHFHVVPRPSLSVVGNVMVWFDEGVLVDFEDSEESGHGLIHMCNKNVTRAPEGWQEGVENVLVLGDSTEDATMADGGKDFRAVLKVGFCNDLTEEKATRYEEHFDIVVDGREGFGFIKEMILSIVRD
ncbi:hypothetical protein TrCOL_g5335 [Triparma columacea]|uniref:5'-nucleotidase n=1 Tax=Triparma columacea TaxID=722753 RepID=A0A9W7GPQ6_9STRA|nr:hypothetical protein TrCOL_g5335 [Triparma columacea]